MQGLLKGLEFGVLSRTKTPLKTRKDLTSGELLYQAVAGTTPIGGFGGVLFRSRGIAFSHTLYG